METHCTKTRFKVTYKLGNQFITVHIKAVPNSIWFINKHILQDKMSYFHPYINTKASVHKYYDVFSHKIKDDKISVSGHPETNFGILLSLLWNNSVVW